MNWLETTNDDLPVWSGVDSVFNVWWQNHRSKRMLKLTFIGAFLFLDGMGALACLSMADTHSPWGDQAWREWYGQALLWLGGAVFLSVVFFYVLTATRWSMPSKFFERAWVLMVTPENELAYKAGAFTPPLNPYQISRHGVSWSVPLDAISGVEADLTTKWEFQREYDGNPWHSEKAHPIPQVEFQTFLHLSDGSRRVLMTSNADREGTGTLAVAVRGGIEARRSIRHRPASNALTRGDSNGLKL